MGFYSGIENDHLKHDDAGVELATFRDVVLGVIFFLAAVFLAGSILYFFLDWVGFFVER